MAAYLDASILLRRLFREPGALGDLGRFGPFIASTLLEVECFRTLHRARLSARISDEEGARKAYEIHQHLEAITRIRVSDPVLRAAKRPFHVSLGTLDSIHLASALLWREGNGDPVTLLTHDAKLAAAGRAEGFPVFGA